MLLEFQNPQRLLSRGKVHQLQVVYLQLEGGFVHEKPTNMATTFYVKPQSTAVYCKMLLSYISPIPYISEIVNKTTTASYKLFDWSNKYFYSQFNLSVPDHGINSKSFTN